MQSGGQSRDSPLVVAQGIENSIVQAVLATLPELDPFRSYTKSAPERRAVDRTVFESRLDLAHSALKLLPVADLFALWPGAGPYLAAARAGLKLLFGFIRRRFLGRALDSALSVKRVPIESQRDLRIAHRLAALAAVVICDEYDAALVAALQEHDARGHAHIG